MIGSASRSLDITVRIIVTCPAHRAMAKHKAISPLVPVDIAGVSEAEGHKSAATHDAESAAFFGGTPRSS
jgi:hypothetical protein